MFKKTLALISAIMLMFSFSACKEEKSDLTEIENTTSTTEISTTEANQTAKPIETQTTTTRTTTQITTTVLPTLREDFQTSVNTPNEAYLYADGKQEKVTPKQISQITQQLNIYLKDSEIGVLKLAVNEGMIEQIKTQNKAIELIYKSEQTYVMLQKTGGPNMYRFEKVLIPLDGERKGYVFFCKDGTYQHGPLKSLDSRNCIEEIVSILDNG